MRNMLIGDALAAARALCRVAPERRLRRLFRMCWEADRANAYRLRTARMHPIWGDGSLMAAALRRKPVLAGSLDDPEFRTALILVLGAGCT